MVSKILMDILKKSKAKESDEQKIIDEYRVTISQLLLSKYSPANKARISQIEIMFTYRINFLLNKK